MKPKKILLFPLISALLAGFAWIIFLITYKALGSDNNTILRGDLYAQYIDFISMFLRVLKGEESFWYSFSIYLGSGSVLTNAYYCLTPFNLLYLLDFISIPAMTMVIIGLKFALAAASFTFFCNRILKQNSIYVCIFSLFYTFNTFSITFYFNTIWLDALYTLPILVYLLFNLVKKGHWVGLTLCWTYLFITNFYMAYILGVFAVLIFISLIIYQCNKINKVSILFFTRRSLFFALSVVLAAGMSCIILLPSALFLLSHMADDNFVFQQLKNTLPDVLNSLFAGIMPHQDNNTPLLYCGLLSLLLLPFYFFNNKIVLKERVLLGALLIFFVAGTLFLPLFIALHAFDYPNWYAFRFSFIISFMICAVSCRQFTSIKDISKRRLWSYVACLIFFFSFMMGFWPLSTRGSDVTSGQFELAVNLIFLIAWTTFLICKSSSEPHQKKDYIYVMISVVLVITEINTNSYICMQHTNSAPLSESSYNQWYYPEKDAIDKIKHNDPGLYRISMVNERSTNAASMFGYASFNTFSTSDIYDLRTTLHDLGICTFNRVIEEYGYTPLTYMLLGRKYTVLIPHYDDDDDNITAQNYQPAKVIKETYSLPIGYMVNDDILHYVATDDPFFNQENLIKCMTGKNYHFYEPIHIQDIESKYYNMRMDNLDGHYTFTRKSNLLSHSYAAFAAPLNEKEGVYCNISVANPEARSDSASLIVDQCGFVETPLLSYGGIYKGAPQPELFPEDHSVFSIYFSSTLQQSEFCEGLTFARFDDAELPSVYEDLNSNSLTVSEFTGDKIIGTVTADAEKTILFTTIPWEIGWHAIVDDKETEIISVLGNAFIAVPLSQGTHEIELKYIAPGSSVGKTISIASILIFTLLSIITFIRYRRSLFFAG